jgi:hypothetical protein
MKWSKKDEAKWAKKRKDVSDGHSANNLEREGWVKDRKTGEYYDPKAKFDELMNKPEILASLKRLSIR